MAAAALPLESSSSDFQARAGAMLSPQALARIAHTTRRRADGRLIVALIPAHNEEEQIGEAIRSLHEQGSPPDVIVVCADNCTDGTAGAAMSAGAGVFETVDNEDKKARAQPGPRRPVGRASGR
jgi:hypothetical protein